MIRLRHNRIELALHDLRHRPGRTLLILHGLGESAPVAVPGWAELWSGPIAALDFTGHGHSTVPRGGGYTSEMLLGDADAALAHLDRDGHGITVLGRGLGAYIALQLAGGRASQVVGAVLCDGPGLAGGPSEPVSQNFFAPPWSGHAPDPYALVELGRDLRPPDYATAFVRLAVAGARCEQPISVAARFRPPWLQAVVAEPGVRETSIVDALAVYAATSPAH